MSKRISDIRDEYAQAISILEKAAAEDARAILVQIAQVNPEIVARASRALLGGGGERLYVDTLRGGGFTDAVKLYRNNTGCTLQQAADYIRQLRKIHGIVQT